RQPRRVRRAARRRRPPLSAGRRLLVRGRGDEQLPVEPELDVPASPGEPLPSGRPLPARLARRSGIEPAPASGAGRTRRGQDRRAGDRDHPRHAVQLRRQQALVVQAVRRAAFAAALLLLLGAAPAGAATQPATTTAPKLTGFTAPPRVRPALSEARVK